MGSEADALAPDVARFKYNQGPLEEQLFKSETPGPFKYERNRYPVDAEGKIIEPKPVDPDVAARGIADMSPQELRMYAENEVDAVREMAATSKAARVAAEKQRQYAHLAEKGDPDLANSPPLVKTIMSKVDEPVYAEYAPKEITTTTAAGRPQKFKMWVPTQEAINNKQVMDMGQIREMLLDTPPTRDEFNALVKEMRDPNTPMIRRAQIKAQLDRKPVSPQKKAQLKAMLGNHIRAVEDWVKSGPDGFNTPTGYTNLYRQLYGFSPKDAAKGAKAVEAARSKVIAGRKDLDKIKYGAEQLDELGLPKSPFEDGVPTYKEVLEYSDAPADIKEAWVRKQFDELGLTEAHIKFLAQADSPQEYLDRVWKLANIVDDKADEVTAIANAIDDGKILAKDEPGIPELMKHYKTKSLSGLVKKIREEADNLAAYNEKYIDYVVPTEAGDVSGKAVNTGMPKPWEARAQKMARKAKEKAAKKKAAENKPGSAIIEDVVNGNKAAIEAPKVTFNTNQQAIFNKALKMAVDKNIIKPSDKSIWQWLTKTDVAKDSPLYNKGNARVEDAWNVYSQYDFFSGLLTDIKKVDSGIKDALNSMGVHGADRLAARADYVHNLLMEPMRAMDEMLKAGGIFPVAGTRQYDTPFSFYDAFSSLPDSFVKKNIFTLVKTKTGSKSRIAPTQLMEVLDIGVAAMKNPEQTDNLADLLKAALVTKKKTAKGNWVPNYMPYLEKNNPAELDGIVNDIIDSLPDLAQKVEKNSAMRKLWHENQRFEGSQAALDEIAQRVMSPDYSIAESLALSNDVDPIIKAITRSKGIDATDEFYVRAEVNAGLPELIPNSTRAEAKRATKQAGAKTKKAKAKVGVDTMEEAAVEASKIADEAGVPLKTFESKFEATMLWKMLSSFFPHLGNETIRPMMLSKASAAQTIARKYQSQIGRIATEFTDDEVGTAWKELQVGRWSKDERILAAQKELNGAIGTMFSDDAKYALANRIGLNAEELNAHFEHFGIHKMFHFDSNETMHNAWREWDTKDPLDLLSKMFAATEKTAGKKLLGDQLMLDFGSTTPKPGFVKIKASRNSEILRYIDSDTYYFPREIAGQMRVLDEFLKTAMEPTRSGVGSGFLKAYDSVLHAYKAGLTVYRPGHHARNMTGDVWLSYMAGVTNPTVYKDALKVMQQMHGRYEGFDAIKALAAGDAVPLKDAQSIVMYANVGGKRVGLTAGDIYRGLFDHGVLPDYRTLEDLQIGTEGAFNMPKVFGGRVHKVATTVSQDRDHYVRIAHAIDVLKKGKFKNLEDAMEQTSHTVRKWHPDGSDLTHWESKVMRRTIMFYSWIRKAIPLIIEGMVMRPGRAMAYPKAMYNLAEANGIDLKSIGDPFPVDQMFPDYLTESLQGPFMTQNRDGKEHYMGIQPGIPMLDVMGDYAGHNPMSTVIGSATPLLKLPVELGYGSSSGAFARDIRTDIPQFDKSDYLDKQIPNANIFVNSTGHSLTQPWQSKGGADREYQPDTNSAWINFLAGLGLIDMSRPGAIIQGKKDNRGR